jgi:hypothetical protein
MATTYSAIGEAGTRNNGRHRGLALLVIATAQLMVVLDDHRQRRAAARSGRARIFRQRPGMGDQRVRPGPRRTAPARRPGRRPARTAPDVRGRRRPPAWPARPARRHHRNSGSRRARLRPVQRRDQSGRNVALGRRQGGETRVGEADSGVASSLLNVGRQVGGSIGLAVESRCSSWWSRSPRSASAALT